MWGNAILIALMLGVIALEFLIFRKLDCKKEVHVRNNSNLIPRLRGPFPKPGERKKPRVNDDEAAWAKERENA